MAGTNRVFLGPTSEFPSFMTGRLTTMRQGGILTDFTITADANEPKLRCHKVVLAIHSPYFEAMFTSDMVESATNTVHYDDINPETMRLVLEYCYREQIDFPDDQLMPLIEASDFLQIERLKKRCVIEVKTFLKPENVLQYLTFAVEQNLPDVKSWCLVMIVNSFSEVSHQSAFIALTYAELQECLTKVIQSDVQRDEVLRAMFSWISNNGKDHGTYMEELLQQIDLEKCSLPAILEVMNSHKAVIASNLNVFGLLTQSTINHIIAQYQMSSQVEGKPSEKQLVIVGGHVDDQVNLKCWALDSKQNKFTELCSVPFKDLAKKHSVCAIPEGLALTGGEDSDLCVVFVASIKAWRRMQKMLRKREQHASICIQAKLYVLGGTVSGNTSASVDCLTLESGLWESLPDAPVAIRYPKVAELKGKLYMLDACSDTEHLLQYDIQNNTWLELASGPGSISPLSSMIAVDGRLCVAGGKESPNCAWYKPAADSSTGSWNMGQQKPIKSHDHGSLVQKDTTTLLLLGGVEIDEVEELNITDGSWSLSKLKMPAKLSGHTALYLDIP